MNICELPSVRSLVGVVTVLALLMTSARPIGAFATEAGASASAPDWMKDLVVYEIATKAFTSPHGPQSGTFESLRERLPYLQDLGITGIWLSGHSLSDPRHFYNIWSQYAVIEPDRLDPTLGSAEQFKAMIDEAHRRGIRVFLDVITHGVMPESSLVKRHPNWFRGGSWGMMDYDWQGGHTDLDDWWVSMWSNYVIRYGVDGFRLDLVVHRPDLWARVRQNAARAGHPIVVFAEASPVIPGVTDFMVLENEIGDRLKDGLREPYAHDIPSLYSQRFATDGDYKIVIQYADHSRTEATTVRGEDSDKVKLVGFTTNRLSRQPHRPTGESELQLTVGGVSSSPVENIIVTRLDDRIWPEPTRWSYGMKDGVPLTEGSPLKMEGTPPVVELYLTSFYGYGPSILLSCHDNGWTGFPTNKNPYVAEGSRATFGYSFLFTPMIPIFMSGEEFDANFHAAPTLSPNLYGGKSPGKGKWLYGAELDWSELNQRGHRSMLDDVKRMLAIRRREWRVLAPQLHEEIEPALAAVPYRSDFSVPVPYMRWNGRSAIIVAANRSTEKDAHLSLRIPLEKIQQGTQGYFSVTDLWNERALGTYSAQQLNDFQLKIKRDKTAEGGLALLKIEAVVAQSAQR
jgi:hypothetical protein